MDGTQLFFLPLIFLFPLKKSTIRMGPLIGPVVIEYNPPPSTHTHTSTLTLSGLQHINRVPNICRTCWQWGLAQGYFRLFESFFFPRLSVGVCTQGSYHGFCEKKRKRKTVWTGQVGCSYCWDPVYDQGYLASRNIFWWVFTSLHQESPSWGLWGDRERVLLLPLCPPSLPRLDRDPLVWVIANGWMCDPLPLGGGGWPSELLLWSCSISARKITLCSA